MSLLEPIEQIIGVHHAYLRRVLPEILQEIKNTDFENEKEAAKSLRENFELLSEDLHKHMLKEEILLFPSMMEIERCALSGAEIDLKRYDIQNPLEQMEYEHGVTENFLAEIHAAGEKLDWQKKHSGLYRRIQELEADLLRHIRLEEENLFREARKLYIRASARSAK